MFSAAGMSKQHSAATFCVNRGLAENAIFAQPNNTFMPAGQGNMRKRLYIWLGPAACPYFKRVNDGAGRCSSSGVVASICREVSTVESTVECLIGARRPGDGLISGALKWSLVNLGGAPMPVYEPSATEIEAALESWFSDSRTGWRGNPTFANREFWRQTMRDALIAADTVRVAIQSGRTVYANAVRRISPRAGRTHIAAASVAVKQ